MLSYTLFHFLFIIWDMDPIIFKANLLGADIVLGWYGVFFALSFVLGWNVMSHIFKKEDIDKKDADSLLIHVVIGTVAGARIGHYLFYEWPLLTSSPGTWFINLVVPPFSGLASHGAAIGIMVALFIYVSQRKNFTFLWLTDRMVIAVCCAGVIRLGNLFNSEIYGKATSVPWAFLFVRETKPSLLPVVPRHPTQLYEMLFCVLLFVITFCLWKYKRNTVAPGFITGIFFILLFSFRFCVEFLKNNQDTFERSMTINMGQVLSLPFIILGVAVMLIGGYRGNQENYTTKV